MNSTHCRPAHRCHRPPTGPAFGRPDDKLRRAIQQPPNSVTSGLDAPPSRGMTPENEVEMQRTKSPFRADHVGSLLRPAPLKEARVKRGRNEITAEQLKEVEDREIEKAIKKQEDIGLHSITDGEYHRA